MAKIRGVIFDLDGTLLDSLWVWSEIDRRFLNSRGLDVPADYARTVSTMGFLRCAEYTVERFGLKETPRVLMDEWMSMAREIYANEIALKNGARELLCLLKDRGMKLAVATSSEADLYMPALKANGIDRFFDCIVDTSTTRGKDFPDVYLLAAKRLKLLPCECAVFEDLPAALVSAKSGGFYTVGVKDRHMTPTPEQKKCIDLEIENLGNIIEFPFE